MKTIIGIDLGTTHSLVAAFQEGEPRLIRNAHGDFLTPSVVGVATDGRVLVGSAARELRVTRPENCVSQFKRWMGTDKQLEVAGRKFSAVELSSLVLRSLKEDAEAHLGESVTEAVITVPAYFNDHQRKATKQAGELAGLKVRRIINEPTAAALVYGFHEREAEKKLIVIDLGGGTFDVTVMEVFLGTLEIVSTAGETQLGGEDFTARMVAEVLKDLGENLELAEMKKPLLVSRLTQECERAKRALATSSSVEVRVPTDSGEFTEETRRVEFSRERLAKAVEPLLDRIRKPIVKALRDARLEPDSVEDIVLVGGSCRTVAVQELVRNLFGRPGEMKHDPDQVVALGAAIQAALIADDAAVEDIVVTDVCPFSLGVAIAKDFGDRIVPGYYLPIIHRNTTIPVSREEIVSTINAGQREISVEVFQGESRRTEENVPLGKLRVTDIPPGPAGQEVVLRFTFDLNGILEVEAIVKATGARHAAVLTQNASSMTATEIEDAVRRMQAIKFFPRDDLENQRLLAFAERVVGEVAPYHRSALEEAIDTFEASMQSGEREYFAAAKQNLEIVLSRLGFDSHDESRDV